MDISNALKNTETDFRDLITYLLNKKHGKNWIEHCGVTVERIQTWEEKQEVDLKRIGYNDNRLINYSDFYDLKVIVKKHWDTLFKPIFDNYKEFEILYGILEKFRNPDAHRRELLPFQINLVIGITGKFRSQITSFFSKMETGDAYYSRIEGVQDNLGNSWSIGQPKLITTHCILRPGSTLEFTSSAFDPLGGNLQFAYYPVSDPNKLSDYAWGGDNKFSFSITNEHVSKFFFVHLFVKSERDFHQMKGTTVGSVDDKVTFQYEVLPPLRN